MKSWTVISVFSLLLSIAAAAQNWVALGPEGGDARSLAADPRNPDRILLGTSSGTLFLSNDGGRRWARWVHLGSGNDYVLDHIAFDSRNPGRIFVAAWSIENQHAGDLFRSDDDGKTWTTITSMHNKSIRALAIAPSDSRVLVAGAADGIYCSRDGGASWASISNGKPEIRDLESIAVSPANPDVIYAGTLHLPWKTTDGGATWQRITNGMIQDSDVFSIIVDPASPSVVYASACSGIYRSDNGAELFQKVQGIPFSARRTRVLKQDVANPAVVYAGTTEGLWKSTDSGKTWKQVSSPEIVVNDVLIDAHNSGRVLLATDRRGILASDNGGQTLTPSNLGYTHRYVAAVAADGSEPETIYASVLNAGELGGVFVSHDGGKHWNQAGAGLGGRDVFALKQAAHGEMVAGASRGIFVLARGGHTWEPANTIVTEITPARKPVKGKAPPARARAESRRELTARVNAIEIAGEKWLAATTEGLFVSTNRGKSWRGGPVLGERDFIAVSAQGDLIALASRSHLLLSADGGKEWKEAFLGGVPAAGAEDFGRATSLDSGMRAVEVAPSPDTSASPSAAEPPRAEIFALARAGIFRSLDAGGHWQLVKGLPDAHVNSITYDAADKRLLAATSDGVIYESDDGGAVWRAGPDTGYPLRRVIVNHGRLLAASSFNGVIAPPE